jgi:hypothetical protein
MILKALVGLSLVSPVSPVSLDSQVPSPDPAAWLQMSARQKDAALLPLVQRATACIVRQVSADPRYRTELRPDEVGDLIVDSISACRRPVRAMIEAHDRMYGSGSGEAFLLGPYLDVLPAAVVRQVKVKAPSRE